MNEAELIKRFRELDAKIPQQKSRMKYAEDKTTYLKELELLQKDQEYTISLLKG